MVRIGCSGWSYQHWKGRFYPGRAPESGWLGLYAETFDTVEVNATFYRLPLRSTVAGWAARTPRTFLFAVKASRYLTHVKRLRDLPAGLARLEERIAPLREADKLGPVLWQLPASFRRDDVRLAETLARLPDGRHAFEFRHPSWFDDDVYALLREHRAALVVADRNGLPEAPWVDTAGWWYVRLHHGRAGRRGNYSPAELERWAERLRGRSGDAYVYFNNDWEGFAPQNAATLRSLVADR
ncbi:DUF72 domain-containing protein [Gaiella sp.]|jgi:uncharacterized protein YecE (DUF72 family)|uniref:DUF72 domain-containing protein n=1 Tax=Gaiella sp. TaxID=2663207 RepID=UPI002CF565B4|nr:DUF72 domain-containing protein [Gaiella sp.]HWO82061.1 DUF72 domain-containing protein [Gaiella sp.]